MNQLFAECLFFICCPPSHRYTSEEESREPPACCLVTFLALAVITPLACILCGILGLYSIIPTATVTASYVILGMGSSLLLIEIALTCFLSGRCGCELSDYA